MEVKDEYMGREDEMLLEVTGKDKNNKLVTEQKEGPFKSRESTQLFRGNENNTYVRHSVEYKFPTSGKILNILSSKGADKKVPNWFGNKIRHSESIHPILSEFV